MNESYPLSVSHFIPTALTAGFLITMLFRITTTTWWVLIIRLKHLQLTERAGRFVIEFPPHTDLHSYNGYYHSSHVSNMRVSVWSARSKLFSHSINTRTLWQMLRLSKTMCAFFFFPATVQRVSWAPAESCYVWTMGIWRWQVAACARAGGSSPHWAVHKRHPPSHCQLKLPLGLPTAA